MLPNDDAPGAVIPSCPEAGMRISLFRPLTMAHSHRLVAAVLCGLAMMSAPSAIAQQPSSEAEARRVFEAGEVAFSAGHYADALGYFQRAHTLSQRPALLFNIALCQDRLRDDDAAIEAYQRYLEEVPLATNRREVDGRLEALRSARARREAAARAVAPAHVAQAATAAPDATADHAPIGATEESSEGTAFYATWWFWTIVGVVVVGASVGVGIAASGPQLPSGDIGSTIFTLGGGR